MSAVRKCDICGVLNTGDAKWPQSGIPGPGGAARECVWVQLGVTWGAAVDLCWTCFLVEVDKLAGHFHALRGAVEHRDRGTCEPAFGVDDEPAMGPSA